MKCEYCAGDISIDNAFCPHCGKQNKFYEAHRADMDAYERRFKATEEKVAAKASVFSRRAVFITVVAILACVILAEALVLINMFDINYALEKARNTKNSAAIVQQLNELEQSGDYLEMHNYYSRYSNIDRKSGVNDFVMVDSVAAYYTTIVNSMSLLAAGDCEYETAYDKARQINTALSGSYEVLEKSKDRPEDPKYEKQHMDAVGVMIDQMHAYISTYCDIPSEIVSTFPDMTDAQRFNVLNEALEKIMIEQ